MEHQRPSTALFDVFLRLRPSSVNNERFLHVEHGDDVHEGPSYITIQPPSSENRKHAVERFGFTRVFEESAGQRDILEETGVPTLLQGVLGAHGREGRDGLLATLGVTGSGKSHTILGSKTQRGLTQLALDVLFRHIESSLVDADSDVAAFNSICAADVAQSQIQPAAEFLDHLYDYGNGRMSRATTPGMDISLLSVPVSKRFVPRVSALPQAPSIEDLAIEVDTAADYAVVISMYEVYNDRIFDLLTTSASGKTPQKRRQLLFKSTELSPDRKVVTGLKKVICGSLEDALLVLETGLHERRVAGTGSNAVSSRSHGFFCLDVKKRHRGRGKLAPWTSSTMTIVDLAGSERARTAKTAGATLQEAGKINESLMYLGQCMQMQSDNARAATPNLVPYRQCKLTELLFSNSFATSGHGYKAPQKSIMIVTADPLGDFNATSQILRYSALAREITKPRIPSVTSTILSAASTSFRSGGANDGRSTPSEVMEELEAALAEVARLRDELEVTQLRLADETHRRIEAEASWTTAEARIDEIEAEIREEVWTEAEVKLAQEQRRWRAARDEEIDRNEQHLDRKLDILTRGFSLHVDDDKENAFLETPGDKGMHHERVAELEDENDRLRDRIALMEREKSLKSPSKKTRVLKSRKWDGSSMGLDCSP